MEGHILTPRASPIAFNRKYPDDPTRTFPTASDKAGSARRRPKSVAKHMQPTIKANSAHEVYVYSFGADPDRICAFQVYESEASANAFLKSDQYLAYQREVEALLEGPPQVEVFIPQWIKGIS